MKIDIFTPPKFTKKPLDVNSLNNLTNKNWQYSANGRASIYHILKSINTDKILIPIYICETVLIPLKKLNITPIFYDVELEDLNASLDSIKSLSKNNNVKAVLVASMYGNPANLVEIEKYCKDHNIYMIDDAAQSFGSKLDNRYIGTFGNAGFFSFSPGKPTAGHMGSFFWSESLIDIKRTNHFLTHYIRWLDFYVNRYKTYNSYNKILKKIINITSRILLKYMNIYNDNICKFEEEIVGGILSDNFNGKFGFREKYQEYFFNEFNSSQSFRILKSIRGTANNHKLVVLFYEDGIAQKFLKYMFENSIYALNGYRLLFSNVENFPHAKSIEGKVVELPIEDDEEKMNYLFQKVREFEY